MLVLRSLAFNVAFYANLVIWIVGALPVLLLPRRFVVAVIKGWASSSLWLLRVIARIDIEVRGRENMPAGGLILAAKHQSLWETFALLPEVADGAYILKKELMRIPLFGWYLKKDAMVPVDRAGGSAALKAMTRDARRVIEDGRQIILFPEGTRRPPGAPPDYKFGVTHLYGLTGATCVPVALNSGLFWPRRKFLRRPGTIVVEILPPIPPGVPRAAFLPLLQARIEEASDRLLAEGRASLAGGSRAGPLVADRTPIL